ncbi:MAG: hypothetical protein IJ040_04960, partial [Lachnospiraceae bacterium]|nr:hypothetical protein [Lachnospiraceae bacterium]
MSKVLIEVLVIILIAGSYLILYSERGSQLKSADCHYSCMKFDDILSLPVESIAAEDSILFLWVTFPLL